MQFDKGALDRGPSANPDLVRAAAAREGGLHSAYFFPVTFVASDGRLLRPGVLEFFSELQRQPDAQLPGLAESAVSLRSYPDSLLLRHALDGLRDHRADRRDVPLNLQPCRMLSSCQSGWERCRY